MAQHEQEHGHVARPRPDDTPPRNSVIFTYTFLAAATLAGLSFVFDSYMDISARGRRTELLETSRTSAELAQYRTQQRARLTGGSMPIDRAMAEFARQDRRAFPLIRPQVSGEQDQGPLDGWSQLPRRTAAAAPAVEAEAAEASAAETEAPAAEAEAPEAAEAAEAEAPAAE